MAASRACSPPPCRQAGQRVAQVGTRHHVYAAPGVTWQLRSCPLQTTTVKIPPRPLLCARGPFGEGLELPTSATKTQCPQSFRRPVRDLGCTAPSCLKASLAGRLQGKDSRRPSSERVSLDPVPWESSGGSNAGKHRRGSGRAVQIVPPFRALVQQAPGSSTLAASPAAPRPMTAALRLPFQASVHDESTPRLSVRDMGKCTWQWVADRDLVSYCPSPPASTPHAHAISTPAQPTWTACPIPATKLELPTHTLDSDIPEAMQPALQALHGHHLLQPRYPHP